MKFGQVVRDRVAYWVASLVLFSPCLLILTGDEFLVGVGWLWAFFGWFQASKHYLALKREVFKK